MNLALFFAIQDYARCDYATNSFNEQQHFCAGSICALFFVELKKKENIKEKERKSDNTAYESPETFKVPLDLLAFIQ